MELKVNCPVMLLRNINHSEGLCNRTRLTCLKFEINVIFAEITTGEYCGKQVFLPRISFIPLKTDRTTIQFKRIQFPIRSDYQQEFKRDEIVYLLFVIPTLERRQKYYTKSFMLDIHLLYWNEFTVILYGTLSLAESRKCCSIL
ncbi:uncharacterized protein LOC111366635 [Olea europaea var. sylvestris]|uniref:uncharacterized protein LOC111366635 n=1 Tax=Olea europaea var. sylvestris TaxID=158386 RepID=UPI000C1CF958|nr:uncharacterized protein LOC111366635 [Olea europaea var. sylvestris]